MKIIKACLMVLALLLIFTSSSNTHILQSKETKKMEIDLTKDFQRLTILQEKFKQSTNPLDRYNYSSAIIEYTERMLKELKEINSVYYKPAMLIMTGEIPDPRDPQFISPLDEKTP